MKYFGSRLSAVGRSYTHGHQEHTDNSRNEIDGFAPLMFDEKLRTAQ